MDGKLLFVMLIVHIGDSQSDFYKSLYRPSVQKWLPVAGKLSVGLIVHGLTLQLKKRRDRIFYMRRISKTDLFPHYNGPTLGLPLLMHEIYLRKRLCSWYSNIN